MRTFSIAAFPYYTTTLLDFAACTSIETSSYRLLPNSYGDSIPPLVRECQSITREYHELPTSVFRLLGMNNSFGDSEAVTELSSTVIRRLTCTKKASFSPRQSKGARGSWNRAVTELSPRPRKDA